MNPYQHIFEHAKVGIALCSAKDNRLEMVNPAFARIHGYEPDELIGVSPGEIFAPECMAHVHPSAGEKNGYFCSSDDVSFETVHTRKDGSPVEVSVHVTVVRDENGAVSHRITNLQDISERKSIEKQIEFLAHHDPLTGLPNRILLKDRVEQAVMHAQRNHSKVALLCIDMDGFKTINDSLGHSVGDEVLKIVSARLKECLRKTDTISRQGGDEFVLILPEITDTKGIVIPIVRNLLESFQRGFRVGEHTLSTSISIGIALFPDDGETFEPLLQKAETAMYKAKELGRNTYCFYIDRMNEEMIEQLTLQSDLLKAIENNEFVLHYQPQIDLKENRITGAEALIRWRHPRLGMVPPVKFIPLAESSGAIVQIGQWVIREACRQACTWYRQGMDISVAVNISPIQFKRGNLESVVKEALADSELPPRYLELEVTESVMMHDTENTLRTVCSLKEIGVQLSIDDFGTGYSSLAYLKRFAVDNLKIDQSFVRDISTDHDDAVIVKTIIQMARSLNLRTIAEGVENEQVLSVLEEHGCDAVQGYHFAKPMEAGEFERYYKGRE